MRRASVLIEPRRDFRRQPSVGSFSGLPVMFSGDLPPDRAGGRERLILSGAAVRHKAAARAELALFGRSRAHRLKLELPVMA